ncbi:MAG: hypothetical protein UZ15_CFX003001685, partial [Chloroflexi bacterium OLB15]
PPYARLIQNEVEDRLSDGILSSEFKMASVVRIGVKEEELFLETVEDEAEGAELAEAGG